MGSARAIVQSEAFLERLSRATLYRPGVRRAALVTVAVVSAAVLFVGLFYVWTRMQIVQIGYEISTMEEKNKDLKNRKRELMLEMASLQSPGELEKKASKLGLVFPAVGKVVHVP